MTKTPKSHLQTSPTKQRVELFQTLAGRELKGKYRRTFLGQIWSLANPLALMLVYTFVFSFVIKIQLPTGNPSGLSSFPLWLLAGLLPWIFFSTVLTQGIGSLISNESLIRKVYFPRSLLVFSSVAAASVNWIIEMAVLIFALLVAGAFGLLPLLPALIYVMFCFVMFATGIVLILAIANVYFRDTEYLIGVGLQLGMYLSPVVYPLSLVQTQSEKIGPLFGNISLLDVYLINPMVVFLSSFREIMFDNRLPSWPSTISMLLLALISLSAGLLIFKSKEKKLAELL